MAILYSLIETAQISDRKKYIQKHSQVRPTLSQVDAIVFLVDAVDRERFSESKRELDGLLADEALAKVVSEILLSKVGRHNTWPK